MIFNGELNEGDALPSMRVLAKELRISIITTKRAYFKCFTIIISRKGEFQG